MFPKIVQTKPKGKKDSRGHIITNPESLKSLKFYKYKHRVRHRPMMQNYEEIKELKEAHFYLRLKIAKQTTSEPWSMAKLDRVLLSLKTTKARDPNGLVNDLFKPRVIGSDLKLSLLTLLNKVKEVCTIPDFIQ